MTLGTQQDGDDLAVRPGAEGIGHVVAAALRTEQILAVSTAVAEADADQHAVDLVLTVDERADVAVRTD